GDAGVLPRQRRGANGGAALDAGRAVGHEHLALARGRQVDRVAPQALLASRDGAAELLAVAARTAESMAGLGAGAACGRVAEVAVDALALGEEVAIVVLGIARHVRRDLRFALATDGRGA